jgi:hypothetical protein
LLFKLESKKLLKKKITKACFFIVLILKIKEWCGIIKAIKISVDIFGKLG